MAMRGNRNTGIKARRGHMESERIDNETTRSNREGNRSVDKADVRTEFYTVKEVAQKLGISVTSVHALIRRGQIEAIRFPGWRIPKSSLEHRIKKERNRDKAA